MSTAGTIQDPPIDIPITAPHAIEAPAHIAIVETLPTPDLPTATPPGTTADPGITTKHTPKHKKKFSLTCPSIFLIDSTSTNDTIINPSILPKGRTN